MNDKDFRSFNVSKRWKMQFRFIRGSTVSPLVEIPFREPQSNNKSNNKSDGD